MITRIPIADAIDHFKAKNVKIEVGPSLRYRHIYDYTGQASRRKFIVIFMPYWEHVTEFILKIIREVDWNNIPVKIKFHPTTDCEKYTTIIPNEISVTDESISELFTKARMVVGRSCGSQVEAVACGIPVIDIDNPNIFSHDHLPKTGKGVIWDRATNAQEVNTLIKQFEKLLKFNPDLLREEGLRIRALYFSEPTAEHIDQAFELED